MTVCAVMLVKDEADVIGHTVTHLRGHVDDIVVMDNRSTDGTRDLLTDLGVEWIDDPEVGYMQSRKTTVLARMAHDRGHSWVVPCDADEMWYAPGSTVRELLSRVGPNVQAVAAELYDHIPTSDDDPAVASPFARIGWRLRNPGVLPKVACRATRDVVVEMGNHAVHYPGVHLQVPGLTIRHFSWRSEDQYLKKIRNGERAYRATSLPDTFGAHWRAFEGKPDEAVVEHYRRWFYRDKPWLDPDLIYDPAVGL